MMKSLWKTLIILSTFVLAVNCLCCRNCPAATNMTCTGGYTISCNNATYSCFKGETKFNDTNRPTVYTRGCIKKGMCGATVASVHQGVFNMTTYKCCVKNLCNGASSVHISLTVAVCAALLSALWATWEL